MKQVKLSDLYTCHPLKLYYKLYRNRVPPYFDNFLREYGDYTHNLRNDLIRLLAVRCEFGAMNAKYQMHLRLRKLVNLSNINKSFISDNSPYGYKKKYIKHILYTS